MLADCLKKAGKAISAKDAQAIQDLAKQKIESGIDEVLAEAQAVREFLSGIDSEINDLTAKIQKAGGEIKQVEQQPEGEELNQDQTQTDAFKAWFGDSKVVDENGDPLVVYHGSAKNDIDQFDTSLAGTVQVSDWGEGVYFSPREKSAQYYASEAVIRTSDKTGDELLKKYEKVAKDNGTSPSKEYIDLGRHNDPESQRKYKEVQDAFFEYRNHIENLRSGKAGAVYSAYLKIENPLIKTWSGMTDSYLSEYAKEQGHDGLIILSDDVDESFNDRIDEIVAFNPNQIKSATGNNGNFDPNDPNILKQDTLNDQARGSIQLLNGERIIRLTEASDLSTFLHESAHLFLEMEKEFSKEFGLSDDQKTTLEFLGVESFEDIDPRTDAGVEAHEKFARAFEAYLFEGKAPSSKLREAFRKFKSWMKQIYQSFSALNVELNDDIRQVFDRMLATDEEIKAMEAEMQYSNQFDAPQAPESKATQKAQETLEQKILGQLQRQHKKWWKQELGETKKALKEKFLEQSNYRAEYAMRGSSPIEGIDRIDQEQLKELLGGKIPQRLKGISRKGGQDADEVAFAMGYDSAYEMLVDIRDSEPLSKAVDAEAEADMLRKHGDIMSDGTLEEEARNAVRNEERAKILLKELREANKRARKPNDIDRQSLQQAAKDTVAKLTEKQLMGGMVERYHRAEVKSAIEAQRLKDSDPVGAARAKAQQAFNFYLYREARDARNKVEKQRAFLRKMQTRKYSPKQVHPDYIQNIKRYLAAFDFRKNPNFAQRRSELAQVASWVASQESTDGGFIPQVTDPKLKEISDAFANGTLDSVELKPYQDMTIGEIQSVYDMAKHLRFIGGKLSESEKQKKLRYFEGLGQSIRENASVTTFKDGTKLGELHKTAKNYFASALLHADSLLRSLDGFKNGAMVKAVKRKIDIAVTTKLMPDQEKAGSEMAGLYRKYFTNKQLRDMARKKQGIEGTKLSLTKWEAIAMVLNMGNEGNRQALLNSQIDDQFIYSESDLQAVLNSLEKQEMDFVQDVWDYIETFRSELGEVERRRTGVSPKWVEPEPLKTKHGTYKGGYYRLFYDSDKDFRVPEQSTKDLMESASFGGLARAQTKNGMTIERVGSGGRPVLLDISTFHRQINETINFIAMAEAVDEAQSVLNSKAVQNAAIATGNKDKIDALELWLLDTATGEALQKDATSRAFRRIRVGWSASKLMYNPNTIMMQPFGVFQSVPVIGAKNMLKGLVSMAAGTRWMSNERILKIQEVSPFMRERAINFNKDIQSVLSKATSDPSDPDFIPQWFREGGFKGIIYTQKFVDSATWIGGYEKAKQENPDASEQELILEADRYVARSQASGVFSDRTGVERGTLSKKNRQSEQVKTWTGLGSYFFAKANVMYDVVGRTDFKNPKSVIKFISDTMFAFTYEALLIAAITGALPDEDDDESMLEFAVKQTGLTAMSSLPFVRELSGELSGFRGQSAMGAFYKELGEALKRSDELFHDDEARRVKAMKAMNDVIGLTFRLPSSATNRAGDALYRDLQGEDVGALEYLIYQKKDK